MKAFFNKKRIAFTVILAVSLLTLIVLLIVPIGTSGEHCLVFSTYYRTFVTAEAYLIKDSLSSPFTIGDSPFIGILVWQTVVFTLVAAIFVVFLALFLVELKKAGAFKRVHRETKAERLQQQVDDLQRQIDELKQDK